MGRRVKNIVSAALRGTFSIAMVILLTVSLSFAQTGHTTSLKFDKVVHNFGKFLSSSGAKSCTFKYTNVSSEPVVINNILSSCGCSVPEWNKAPIKPGESGEIKVTFLNDQGPYPFDKTLTVYLSSSQKPVILRITGVAYDKEKPISQLYPAHFGPLGMKSDVQNGGQIEQGLSKSLKENVVNLSSKAVNVSFEDIDPALEISIKPSKIEPGESATISYTINTKKGATRWGKNTYKASIVIDGKKTLKEFKSQAVILTPYTGLTSKQMDEASQIFAERSSISFGTAKVGEKIPVSFKFRNPGKKTLVIYKVETGGDKMEINCPAKIAPNATATLTGTITAQTKDPDKVFIITLITNSPQRPIVTLFVSGVIQ